MMPGRQTLRVLYNVEEGEVVVLLVGRKIGNRLIVEGAELHEPGYLTPAWPPVLSCRLTVK